jgi:HlyD family secretion protein
LPETQLKASPKRAAAWVALGLAGIVAASGVAYWRLRPEPIATQVIYGSGRIEADEVRIAPEVAGRLTENNALEGQSLRSGEILARLDPGDYELQADRAEAQQRAALRSAAQIEAQISLAVHHAGMAKVDLDRNEAMSQAGVISAQTLDRARNAYAAAADQITVLRQQRAEADAQAEVARKNADLARSQMTKTRLVAPITGAVLERLAEPGEVIAAGQPIAILADLREVKLKLFVSERELGKVRLGAPVRLRVDAFPGRDFAARVARVDAQAQFTPRDVHVADERSRTVYGVTVEAPNPEGLLKPGMPADAWILWDGRAGWPAKLSVPE